jgi:hypothetical protein
MKQSLILISFFAFFGASTSQADDVLPPRFNFERYAAMVSHSPFAIATAVALPSATSDFAKDLYVANAARSPAGDMVTIASSSDQNFKKYLSTKEPVDGYSIASIEWSDRVGATKVTISKDGKFATITFNEALLSQSAANTPPVQSFPTTVMPAMPAPMVQPPTPRQAPRARVRGVIQRNPKAAPMLPASPLPTPNPVPPSEGE